MDDLCGSIIDGRFREQKVGRSRVTCIVSKATDCFMDQVPLLASTIKIKYFMRDYFPLPSFTHNLTFHLTLSLFLSPSVPPEEVWSSQAHLPGGGMWNCGLSPEFT